MELCTSISSPPLPLPLPLYNPTLVRFQPNHNPPLSGFSGLKRVRALKVSADDESSKYTHTQHDTDNLNVSSAYNDSTQTQTQTQSASSDDDHESTQPFQDIVDNLGIKLESEDSYVLLLYGGGSLVAVWLLTAIVGAIDALPVLPKVMEVVGLGYSLWFTTRYLLFKKNRKELAAKIEELKREVLGSDGD
ncbi:hypothetical protein RND81_11G237500 [Saponaria officinalis]|uniref:Cyanobacterial aminoacyl-tRNA synthetase CAAD domain-containing protein n=1 Tax=Saponaria officinalis TaxID=3572 RepID=A0AAW1HQU5_SAPOF